MRQLARTYIHPKVMLTNILSFECERASQSLFCQRIVIDTSLKIFLIEVHSLTRLTYQQGIAETHAFNRRMTLSTREFSAPKNRNRVGSGATAEHQEKMSLSRHFPAIRSLPIIDPNPISVVTSVRSNIDNNTTSSRQTHRPLASRKHPWG